MELNKFDLLLASYVAISSVVNLFSSMEGRVRSYKTMKTEYGSIYDCMDMYKQPAFDHPLLKNHKIQMLPSFDLQSLSKNTSSSGTTKFGLKNECPRGTVPIRRMSKEERLRSDFSSKQVLESTATGFDSFEFAGMSTKPGNYHGGGGFVSIYNPFADHGQFSASVISIEGGPPEQFSSIRAGWMVNPNLFGDNQTRLYTIWGDTVIGDWWLLYREKDGDPDVQIGYWPNKLFTNLKQGAEVIRWGGMAYSDKSESPPMGSGGKDCHYRLVSLVGGQISEPLESLESRCYEVGKNSNNAEFWGYSFWFGGPGGDSAHCH